MKTHSILFASMVSLIDVSAFAQGAPVDQVKHDKAVIHQETREIRAENRDIRHDNTDIRRDKRDIKRDQRAIHQDRQEAKAAQRREDADIAKGYMKDARKQDKLRQHEMKEIGAEKHDIQRDHGDIAHDRKDRNKDVALRNDERRERHAVNTKHNRDASQIND